MRFVGAGCSPPGWPALGPLERAAKSKEEIDAWNAKKPSLQPGVGVLRFAAATHGSVHAGRAFGRVGGKGATLNARAARPVDPDSDDEGMVSA